MVIAKIQQRVAKLYFFDYEKIKKTMSRTKFPFDKGWRTEWPKP